MPRQTKKEMELVAARLRRWAKVARSFRRSAQRDGRLRDADYDHGAADALVDAAREILHTLRRVYKKPRKKSFARRKSRLG